MNYFTVIVTHLKHTHTYTVIILIILTIRSNLQLLCYAVLDEITSITGTFDDVSIKLLN